MKEDYQKALKKVTLFFRLNPGPFNRQNYQKQEGPGTSCSSGYKASSEKILCYVLSDQVWWCNNIKWFLSYSKNYICKFVQANSWHHKLFHLRLPFWIWKVWKGRGKITKIWISREWNELFRRNKKTFFIVFKGLSFDEKIKIWQKIADTSFNTSFIVILTQWDCFRKVCQSQ